MPLALSIQPSSNVLDVYGDADSSLSFSLSGHVSVSLTSLSSIFVRRRTTARVLLQSLTITFEGQSELLSSSTGYAPLRLCSITRELLPRGPVDLSNEGLEDSNNPCSWNIVFDIPIPGWLPTTSFYGDANAFPAAGTSYALYATATFIDISRRVPFCISNICAPIRSRIRTVNTHGCPIVLQRFVEPHPGSSLGTFPMSVYVVDANRAPDSLGSPGESIPDDVLQRIQVVASIPSAISTDEPSLPLILRVRGKELDNSEGRRLRITEFSVDVEQVEVYRNGPTTNDVNRYPIPSQSHQPPCVPLRNPHPVHTLYDIGFLDTFKPSVKRSFSILASTESARYIISGDGHIFSPGRSSSSEDGWCILETTIPLLTKPYSHDWAGVRKRRITEHSPLFSVKHYVHVVIHCEYSLLDSGKTTLERLNFSLPIKHVNVTELPRDAIENQQEDEWKNIPWKQSLPAYSQLYYSNGERKLDYSTPLPPYESPAPSSPQLVLDWQTLS